MKTLILIRLYFLNNLTYITFHRCIDMGLLHTMEQPHILVLQGKYKLKLFIIENIVIFGIILYNVSVNY